MNRKKDKTVNKFSSGRKSMQSKSLQRLNTKAPLDQISDKLHTKVKNTKFYANSQKFIKNSKFDTPEKNNSPKPHRELIKSPASKHPLVENSHAAPFPMNINIFPKKQISSLIKKGQGTAGKHINPLLLTPVLLGRRGSKLENKSLPVSRSITPSQGKIDQDNLIEPSFEVEQVETYTEESPKVSIEAKSMDSDVFEECKQFFYNKLAQPSFGGEEQEPVFLSERLSYECESNQSLRFEMEKLENIKKIIEQSSSEDFYESFRSSLNNEIEKIDNQTQTEEPETANMLKYLDDNEIKLGIKFISKIAEFMKSFK
jgi:hypothetical protein